MSSVAFNPDTDIPSLAGKVVFVTGGNHFNTSWQLWYTQTDTFQAPQVLELAPSAPWQSITLRMSSSAAAMRKLPSL
jgi:hypothetical protein